MQYLRTSLLYCKGKEYQDSGIKYNPARVESSTVPPKLPKKWAAAAAASRYPLSSHDGSDMQIFGAGLYNDCTMIVPCISHNHSQIFYRGPLSVSTTVLAQFSLFNCYNKLRGTIHLLSSGQSVKCGFSLPAETGRPVSSSSLGSCQPCPLCAVR